MAASLLILALLFSPSSDAVIAAGDAYSACIDAATDRFIKSGESAEAVALTAVRECNRKAGQYAGALTKLSGDSSGFMALLKSIEKDGTGQSIARVVRTRAGAAR